MSDYPNMNVNQPNPSAAHLIPQAEADITAPEMDTTSRREWAVPEDDITYSTDPESPFFLEESARPHWEPPTIADRVAAASGRTIVFAPSAQPTQRYSARGLPLPLDYTENAERRAVFSSPTWLAFARAADRSRTEAQRVAQDVAYRVEWDNGHRCQVCGEVTADTGLRRVLEHRSLRGDVANTELTAQLCRPCGATVALVALERNAGDRLGRRTRRDLAADYLDRVAHGQ